MSEKDVIKDVKVEEAKEEQFKYGISPSLIVTMVKEKKVYRFEMPIGAKLDECEVACGECLKIVTQMKKEGEAKAAEAKTKEAKPSSDDTKKEDK